MNPAHIIRECLTNRDWGLGYSGVEIGASFTAAADALFTEGFGLSLIWQQDSSIEEFIGSVLDHIDATLFIDRRTGLWELKLIRADYVAASAAPLRRDQRRRLGPAGRRAPSDLVNSVTVRFTDATTDDTGAVSVTDTARVQAMGEVIATTLDYPGIRAQSLAVRVAERDLRALSAPLLTGEIVVNREGASLGPGRRDPPALGASRARRCRDAHLRDRPGRRARQRHPPQARRGCLCAGRHGRWLAGATADAGRLSQARRAR
jgi:hypothetical protein